MRGWRREKSEEKRQIQKGCLPGPWSQGLAMQQGCQGGSERPGFSSQWRQSRAWGWRFISRAVLQTTATWLLTVLRGLGSCGGCSLPFANRTVRVSRGGLFELG